ncbi:MAG: spore coat protein [Oscillospiraceae bacterium]|nr:spore coat protein [Oscillospiraceae bacterium]
MANLTSKELTAIEDQLNVEQNLVKKFTMFSQSCSDPQLKTKCEQIASRHQGHYTRLLGHLS